jgi:hypothetical protein
MDEEPAHVLSWLIVGDKRLARDRAALRRANVKYILNATVPRTENGVPNFFEKEPSLEYHRAALRDVNTENLLPHLPLAIEFLERVRVRADGAVLIHCNEGKSRSCTVAAAYLILTHGKTNEEALAMVRAARAQAAPNEAFLRALATLTPAGSAVDEAAGALGAPGGQRAPKRGLEHDGGAEADGGERKRAIGPAAGPNARPATGPSIGPGSRPALGPSTGPEAARPAIGPAIGPTIGPGPSPKPAAELGAKQPPIGP